MILVALLACASPPPTAVVDSAPSEVAYPEVLASLDERHQAYALRWRAADEAGRGAILDEARADVLATITTEMFPRWQGTDWEFHGTTQVPGEGSIACGYYVSTILRDAGFEVDRARLGRQASENILKTMAPAASLHRFSGGDVERVLADVRSQEPGLYGLGLDFHAAMLWWDGQSVRMCHSSYVGSGGVICEDAATSPAIQSNYHVTAPLLSDVAMKAWLEGRALPTVGKEP